MKLATNESVGSDDELRRRAELQDASLADHPDAMREGRRVLEVVSHDDRRQAEIFEELAELGAHAGSRVRVERGERLVEEEHRGVARQRAGQRDALALASRELADARTREVGDAEALEQARRRSRDPVHRSARCAATSRCGNSAYSWKR